MSPPTTASHSSKRSRAAVSEECYASSRTHLRLVGDPTYDLHRSSGRNRTRRGSSDDQDSVQDDSFMNEAFRAGGPRLCTFPVATDSITPAHSSYQSVTDPTERLTRTIMCLLANAGVRSPSGVQRGNSRQSCFLCGQGLYDVGQSIWTHCYVEDVNTTGCFRIGKSNDWAQNPPTVIITVDPNTDLDWKTMRVGVILILANHYFSMVAVKIQRDEVLRDSGLIRSPGMPLHVLQGSALVGQSLRRRGLDDKQGTFGDFIEFEHPHTHKWVCFGMSCTHCVLPDDKQADISKVHESQNRGTNEVPPNDQNAQFPELDHL